MSPAVSGHRFLPGAHRGVTWKPLSEASVSATYIENPRARRNQLRNSLREAANSAWENEAAMNIVQQTHFRPIRRRLRKKADRMIWKPSASESPDGIATRIT